VDPSSPGVWYGVLSMIAGIIGVMLVMESVVLMPKSDFLFYLGIFTFLAAFLLKILQMVYRSD
jgi:hypothetical protein